jgi:hypothetical protein
MYEVRIASVKKNQVNDALNCAVNRIFEGSTATVTTTFRNDVVAKIVGADFDLYDVSDNGVVVGYVLTNQDFSHIDGASFTFNKKDVPKCLVGKNVKITESNLSNIDVVQMDLNFTYLNAMVGDSPAMDSPLWDSYMSTYYAIRQQTNAYVARKSDGMRWTSVCTSISMKHMVIDAYNAIGKMYASKYNVKVVEALDQVDDIIFDHRLFGKDDDDED